MQENLPIQKQDGCVLGSTRSLLYGLNSMLYPKMIDLTKDWILDDNNPDNVHMLAIPIASVQMKLPTFVHFSPEPRNYVLPDNAPNKAKDVHSTLVDKIVTLAESGKLTLSNGELSPSQFMDIVKSQFSQNRTGLAFVDWGKWAKGNPSREIAHTKFRNPRHVIHLKGFNEDEIRIFDPSIPQIEQYCDFDRLHSSMDTTQQLVFIGHGDQEP